MADLSWRERIDAQAEPQPHAVLLGGVGTLRPHLLRLLKNAGWRVHEARTASLTRPLTAVPLWRDAALVIATCGRTDDPRALLEGLRRADYHGPLILLAEAPSKTVRRQALAQGARDVIALPASWDMVEARLRVVLQDLGGTLATLFL